MSYSDSASFRITFPVKPFANHHVGFVQQQIAAFYIPDEMDLVVFFQQRIGSLSQYIALALFLPDI